jgi:hypothetical protein
MIAFDLFVTAVHAAPAANLPLTCPDAAAIGQPLNSCNFLSYQLPHPDQLIVLKGPSSAPLWSRAANVTSTETLAVCSLPVEPGTYSSCRDASGVRRIVFVAKSQVFPGPTPAPPAGSGARILDLSRVPVEITEPGLYVLDRNWSDLGLTFDGAIIISADDVTLDFRGFELIVEDKGIVSTGQRVTIRNGRIVAAGFFATEASGAGTLIEHMRVSVEAGYAIGLMGRGTVLTDSDVSTDNDGVAVRAGDDTIVRENRLQGMVAAVVSSSGTTVADNLLSGCREAPCIIVDGANNIVSGNILSAASGAAPRGILIRGDHNQVLDNAFKSNIGSTAITVDGQGNIIRDNLVIEMRTHPGIAAVGWETGIAFLRDGNFYGDNVVWATTPFNVGATVQTDLGGNSGFGQ